MEITLANFEQVIDPTVLQRGRDYYDGGHIVDLEEIEAGYWQAVVEGTETYRVFIIVAPDASLNWACDCPYDWGPVCKHVAATLYALGSAIVPEPSKKSKPRKKRKTRADKIREALGSLSREELHDLLLQLALDDRELAHLILARYGADQGSKQAYARLVQDALRLGQGRHGFLDYWGAARAAKGVNELLNRADAHLAQGSPLQAIPIYQAALEEVVPAMAQADDSMGALGDCISFALDGLQRAAEELASPERAEIFTYCVTQAPQEPYSGWDWGWELAVIAAELAETPQQQKTLFATLDQMAARRDDERWGSEYDRERAASIKLSIISRQEDDSAVEAFLEAHLQYERMRMALARFHLERGDLVTARQLCTEWLDRPQHDKPGLRPDFLAILLDVAEVEGDPKEQIQLTEVLFRQTGRFEYCERLKELVGAEAWPEYRSGLLQRIKQDRWSRVDLGAFYIAEEMWAALLAHVQANLYSAPYYHDYLSARYPRELSDVYEQLALATVETKINRKGYQEACGYLKRMQQLGQGERVSELVTQLRGQYKQRRALLDELNKAFGR
jgi:uncharacterized Zn finger protein